MLETFANNWFLILGSIMVFALYYYTHRRKHLVPLFRFGSTFVGVFMVLTADRLAFSDFPTWQRLFVGLVYIVVIIFVPIAVGTRNRVRAEGE